MIEAVVFDMDGVLFDTERVYGEAWNRVTKDVNINNLDKIIKSCVGLTEEDTRKLFNKECAGKIFYDDYRDIVKKAFSEIIKEEGLPMKPGVFEILDYLKNNNYKIALASSTVNKIVVGYLKEAKIYDYFQAIVTGDMVEKGKPEPDIYLEACKKLNVNPVNSYAVEDSFNGLRAAYRANMKAIMVPDILQPTEEIENIIHKKFDSLLELKKYLESRG